MISPYILQTQQIEEIKMSVRRNPNNNKPIPTVIPSSPDVQKGVGSPPPSGGGLVPSDPDPDSFAESPESNTLLIIDKHSKWIHSQAGGEKAVLAESNFRGMSFRGALLDKADFRECNVRKTDFWGASLQEANLVEADLRGTDFENATLHAAQFQKANLRSANLRGAKLYCADLRFADLRNADLRCADLRGCDLRGADLRDADIRGTILEGADLCEATLSPYSILPTNGSFVGWMSAGDLILEIQIPDNAQRQNPIGSRSCRADKAVVLHSYDKSATPLNQKSENMSPSFKRGATLYSNDYSIDPRIDRTGIRFFMTFEEAASDCTGPQS